MINGEATETLAEPDCLASDVIGFRDAIFSWSKDATSTFKLRIAGELFFKPGINLITGPTGSGKSSLLMALLGEMHFIPTSPASAFVLPRATGVAYASQDPWVQNETIKVVSVEDQTCISLTQVSKENILFGSLLDKDRYEKGRTPPTSAFDRI